MNKFGKTGWFAFVLAGLSCTLLVPQASADVAGGQRIYLEQCVGCHGNGGVGIKNQGPDLTQAELIFRPDDEWADLIRSGRNMMPPYLGVLNDDEIASVISYLRTLQR